jgi:hypothetical protein
MPNFRGPSETLCVHCSDGEGKLVDRTEAQKGIARWQRSWQPNLTDELGMLRAEYFMKAMPAWADTESEGAAQVATTFARALDRDDYTAAAAMLAPECSYSTGDGTIFGIKPILDSYATNSRWARENLDTVEYESALARAGERSASITFIDRITKGTEHFDHQCQQTFHVDARGLITRIEHHDLPGERDRLSAFFEKCGIGSRTAEAVT